MRQPFLDLSALRERLGYFSLLLFAFCAWLSTTGTSIALVLMLLAFMADPRALKTLIRNPVFHLACIFGLYLALLGEHAAQEFPETAQAQKNDWNSWMKLYGFLLAAWWLKADIRRIRILILCALAGFLLNTLRHMDWSALIHGKLGHRSGFGLQELFFGLLADTSLLGLLLYAPRCRRGLPPHLRRTGVAVWVLIALLLVYGLVFCGSKSAWLMAALIFPPILFLRFRHLLQAGTGARIKLVMAVVVGLLIVIGITSLGFKVILNRLNEDRAVVAELLHGNWKDLPRSSLSYRLDVQTYGLLKWRERPFTGWGTGSSQYLIQHSQQPGLHYKDANQTLWLVHTHNTYIEILLRTGLIGMGLLFLLLYFLLTSLRQAQREKQLSLDDFLFFAGSLVLLATWNTFDFRMLHTDFRAYWIILAGVLYTFRLHSGSLPEDPASVPESIQAPGRLSLFP